MAPALIVNLSAVSVSLLHDMSDISKLLGVKSVRWQVQQADECTQWGLFKATLVADQIRFARLKSDVRPQMARG